MKVIVKMLISDYHMTKETDCKPVLLQIIAIQVEQTFQLIDVVAVPHLNMSTVDYRKLNVAGDSLEHLNYICRTISI